jgi:protein-tyrosine phosphatase
MDTQPARHLPIVGTYNIRDLGGYATDNGQTRWRAVFRADSLHRLDAEGVATLVEHRVRTVVDLRQPAELEKQPNPFATHPGVRYHNVSLFDAVIPPPGAADVLLEMYKLALANRGAALQSILTAIADAEDGAVLFHCTAGKDRTGIVAALLLSVTGVDHDTIVRDYAVTAQMIAPMVDELIAGAKARGAVVESFRPMLASNPETMAAFLEHIADTHGGTIAYLDSIGIDAEAQRRLRARLVEERAA